MSEQVETAERYEIYCMRPCESCGGTGKIDAEIDERGNWYPVTPYRDPDCRGEGRQKVLLASTDSEQGVGISLCTLGREGMFKDCQGIGILDRMGAVGEKWLVQTMWLPSPRNVSDAGRVLASGRKTT